MIFVAGAKGETMRLIDAEALLKTPIRITGRIGGKYPFEAISVSTIENAPTIALPSGWISVNDRLPERLEPVNVVWVNRDPEPYYADIKDKPFAATGYYYNGKWWWFSTTCEDYLAEYGYSEVDSVDPGIEITHWMPLPEPPKEET